MCLCVFHLIYFFLFSIASTNFYSEKYNSDFFHLIYFVFAFLLYFFLLKRDVCCSWNHRPFVIRTYVSKSHKIYIRIYFNKTYFFREKTNKTIRNKNRNQDPCDDENCENENVQYSFCRIILNSNEVLMSLY